MIQTTDPWEPPKLCRQLKFFLEMLSSPLKTKEFVSYRIEALCECSAEDKKGEPRNVLYGWCLKCRAKFPEDYKKVEGWVNLLIITEVRVITVNCLQTPPNIFLLYSWMQTSHVWFLIIKEQVHLLRQWYRDILHSYRYASPFNWAKQNYFFAFRNFERDSAVPAGYCNLLFSQGKKMCLLRQSCHMNIEILLNQKTLRFSTLPASLHSVGSDCIIQDSSSQTTI